MGTHPIFESDFDCLTEMGDSSQPDLSIRNIIIFVLYSGVLIVMFVLLAKRQIRRMKLRYDKNFNATSARSFRKSYRDYLHDKVEKAIEPKYAPTLLVPSEQEVTESSDETKLRMKALCVVDQTFQHYMQAISRGLRILQTEDVELWFSRIAKDGKFSTLQVDSFERLVKSVADGYSRARYMAEEFTYRNLRELQDNCDEILRRVRNASKRKEQKRKKPKAAKQALQFMQKATQSAGKQ